MKSRIDELITLGMKDRSAYEKEVTALVKALKADRKLKGELERAFDESLAQKGKEIRELSVKAQLQEISAVISLSYLARHYFQKSRQWLNHRINGNPINGKPAKFTDAQLETLNMALQDISKRIGSVSVH